MKSAMKELIHGLFAEQKLFKPTPKRSKLSTMNTKQQAKRLLDKLAK